MLPKIDMPTYDIEVPSNGEKIKVRPFTVKEEKILLVAEEGNEEKDILYSIRQIVQNCCVTELDVNKLRLRLWIVKVVPPLVVGDS
mgnify:CR=1 FL=1